MIFCYSYSSHLILDMMTLQGVPLFYPFFKNPFVIPGNPSFRIRNDNLRSETIVFCIFLLLGISLKPLFQNGFWTSYNRFFGTLQHLHAEFQRSPNLLEVEYFTREGSRPIHGTGYCIQTTPFEATLIDSNGFVLLDGESMVIEKVIPTLTEKQFFFKKQTFINISIDSLNQILLKQPIYNLEIFGNKKFQVIQNSITKTTQHYTGDLINNIWLEEVPDSILHTPFIYKRNPRIPILEEQLKILQQENLQLTQEWNVHEQNLATLKNALNHERDPILKEQLFQQYQQALKRKTPKINTSKESLLETEIKSLRQSEKIQNQERYLKSLPKNAKNPAQISGYYETIFIQ